ncbi:hypothetical protein QCA50_003765 [Cerrena zonata]|uniref:Uncharacterized protein n=1 Tax=Cerrena zonata TaxID=2478898 RepID=A0AAW0GRF7_9APHY
MSLPNCELHHIDHVSTETRDATSLYSQLGPVITSLRSSCRLEDLDPNNQDGLSWTCVSRLLQLTVDEMCRLDGSQAQVPAGRSIVCSLLSALSNHLAENISSIVDPPFILPDLNELRVSPDVMDGHALMLALLPFTNSVTELNEHSSIASPRECRAEATPSRTTELSLDVTVTSHYVYRSGRTKTMASDPQKPPFPLDVHILPSRVDPASVHVPLFVVADSTNIKYLMISALYQRFIFSIDEPLVGIEVCNNSPVVQVHLGWFMETGDKVPIVHIAYTTRDAVLGRYDLRELSAAHAFAQLILGLQVQAQNISQIMGRPHIRTLCWRLDHIGYSKSKERHEQIMENVATWRRNLPSPRPRSYSATYHRSVSADSPIGHRRASSATRSCPIHDWVIYSDSIGHISSTEEEDEEDEEDVLELINTLYEQSLQQHIMLEAFVFERDVIFISNLSPREDLPNHEHIKTMYDLYTQFNASVCIEKWKTSGSLSHLCSQALETYCNTLVEQNQNQHTPELLDANLIAILEEKLDIILLPSHYLSRLLNGEQNDPVFYHHLWEYFFVAFCYRDGAMIDGINLHFDVKAQMSKNRHAEMLQNDQPFTVADIKKHTEQLSRDALTRCITDAMSSYDATVQEAHIVVSQTHRRIGGICKLDDNIFSKMILQRAQIEPSEGICDIIASRPAVFESSYSTPRNILCPPNSAFIIPDIPTFNKTTGTPSEESQPFSVPQNRYHGHVPEHYSLKWLSKRAAPPPADTKTSDTVVVSSAESNGPLLLPFIITICQETEEDYWAVTQRLTAHLVSAVDMYAHFGIKDYPVWGVFIGGARCGIMMGWRSSVNDRAYVFQRAIRVYDITIPYEAMQFALFLLRARESQRKLPCTDFVSRHLNPDKSMSSSSPADVVLTMDSTCTDPEGIWSSWMRVKQRVDVACLD